MRETPLELEAEDKVVLRGLIWEPEGAPTALVQILHGMGEHIGRYARLATQLCELGYVVVGHDQRGHGRTIANPADQGHFADVDGWLKVVKDARAVTLSARERFGDLPTVVFGHSMGSYILQSYLFQHDDVAGAVLSGSTLNAGLLVKIGRPASKLERMRVGKRGVSAVLQRLSFGEFARSIPNRRTDFDWISRDAAEVDAYVADKWCGFDVTAGLWCDLSYAFLELEQPQNVAKIRADLPIRIMSGGDDPVHDKRKGLDALVRLYQERGFAKLDVAIYDGARHELLNETNREEVTHDLVQWITSVVTNL